MKQYRSRLIVVFVVLCTLSNFALASDRILQSEKTTDTISIQPTDGVLFEVPKGVEACSHDYYTHTFGETVKYPMDDYYCCYIDITVNLKICKLCLSPGYDFDYKMVSHKDAGNICEYCGRVPFTPVITLPLT